MEGLANALALIGTCGSLITGKLLLCGTYPILRVDALPAPANLSPAGLWQVFVFYVAAHCARANPESFRYGAGRKPSAYALGHRCLPMPNTDRSVSTVSGGLIGPAHLSAASALRAPSASSGLCATRPSCGCSVRRQTRRGRANGTVPGSTGVEYRADRHGTARLSSAIAVSAAGRPAVGSHAAVWPAYLPTAVLH